MYLWKFSVASCSSFQWKGCIKLPWIKVTAHKSDSFSMSHHGSKSFSGYMHMLATCEETIHTVANRQCASKWPHPAYVPQVQPIDQWCAGRGPFARQQYHHIYADQLPSKPRVLINPARTLRLGICLPNGLAPALVSSASTSSLSAKSETQWHIWKLVSQRAYKGLMRMTLF